jgi:hypothetical protein
MSMWDGFRRMMEPVRFDEPASGTMTLEDVLSRYDLVEAVRSPGGNDAIIVTEPGGGRAFKDVSTGTGNGKVNLNEIGTTSKSPWFAEYVPELAGATGLAVYDRMRRSDGTVRGSLRLTKVPVLSGRWFVEAASEDATDQLKAKFVWWNLTERMNFTKTLINALLCLDFGFIPFEKVFAREKVALAGVNGSRIVWSDLAPRHPGDVMEWHYDKNGRWESIDFSGEDKEYTLTRDKTLLFTFDEEVGNVTGVSILRSAYQHWYYKTELYKIDAIQKERHGIGVPVIKLPPNFTDEDRRLAESIGRNLRTNERAHITLPPMWEIFFAEIKGQQVDVLESAVHHDEMIQKNVLARFMESSASSTNRGTGSDAAQNMFLKATRFTADIILAEMNLRAIPQLIDYNWASSPNGYPKLRVRRIGEQADWRTLSFAVRNLIGANAIRPDDRLEDNLREEMDLPRRDPATQRELPSGPQGGSRAKGQRAGLPRQAPAGPDQSSGSRPDAGDNSTDRSGGR